MVERLPSGDIKYPSHNWGALAKDPWMEIGATGEAWAGAVKAAWMNSGGDEESFERAFPQFAKRTPPGEDSQAVRVRQEHQDAGE